MSYKEEALQDLAATLPPIFSRQQVKQFFPGIVSPNFLARLDSINEGPGHFKMANRIFYRRDDFINWLLKR